MNHSPSQSRRKRGPLAAIGIFALCVGVYLLLTSEHVSGQSGNETPVYLPVVQQVETPTPTSTSTNAIPTDTATVRATSTQRATPVGGISPTPTEVTPRSATSTPTATSRPGEPIPYTPTPTWTQAPPLATLPPPSDTPVALVFVSRQIPDNGSIYWNAVNDMPGVGAHSRFRVASPGMLQVREGNGTIRTLVDGSAPTTASLNLIDVSAPDVSWDGTQIVFAGLRAGNYGRGPVNNPNAWRLYAIGADGTNLRQLTFSDQNLSFSQFGEASGGLRGYDDTDPVWLPDGRIVFSSTRYPSFAHYSGVRTTNLFVINADGSGMHRITSDRNGADRPVIDPLTGKIVFSRWWRNHRFATNDMNTISAGSGEYEISLGLTSKRDDRNQVGGPDFLWRNQWHPASINPDGTALDQWGGEHHALDESHIYGASFLPNGQLLANYFPMPNMTEAAGFGGLRLYNRGPSDYIHILGITTLQNVEFVNPSPPSYGIYQGEYASEASWLPNGRIVLSYATSVDQDYGLYTANPDGTELTLLYDNPGTTELRAKPLTSRSLPPILPDGNFPVASPLAPAQTSDLDQDGIFTFDALNVYFNAPVDTIRANAPPVGSADHITFFADYQRTSPGSFPQRDWPILFAETDIAPDGSVVNPAMPADVPVFEQIRDANNRVPFATGNPRQAGSAAHVAGMNYGKPGDVQRCVGCHTGHTMIAVPATDEEALWTNLATGAQVTVSSTGDEDQNEGLNDRRVRTGEIWRYWTSDPNQSQDSQWVQLVFPVPVTVRTVRLYNPRSGDEANSSIQVYQADVRLYADADATDQVAQANSGVVTLNGTNVAFTDVKARAVRIYLTDVEGTFYGARVASLAEVEVIARAEAAE